MAAKYLAALTSAAMVLSLSACGGSSNTPEPRPSPEANARANLTILKPGDLPDGWRRVPAKDRLDGPPGTARYCGVVAEPDPVREGRISYYEDSSLPRSVLEYGMLSTTEGARSTLNALQARRDDCVENGATVTPVAVDVGDESVAWDFEQDGAPPFRTLVFRRDDVVVVLVAVGQPSVPHDEQMAIATSIDGRLSGGR